MCFLHLPIWCKVLLVLLPCSVAPLQWKVDWLAASLSVKLTNCSEEAFLLLISSPLGKFVKFTMENFVDFSGTFKVASITGLEQYCGVLGLMVLFYIMFGPKHIINYCSVLSKWEFFIKMRAAFLALSFLHSSREDGGKKGCSSHFDDKLSFW